MFNGLIALYLAGLSVCPSFWRYYNTPEKTGVCQLSTANFKVLIANLTSLMSNSMRIGTGVLFLGAGHFHRL